MQNFPLFLSLQGRRALVVGGSDAAARKIELLLSAGAQVIADRRDGDRRDRPAHRRRPHRLGRSRPSTTADLDGVSLVIVATDDESRCRRASRSAAQARCMPVNVVDRPALSSFIMPAIVDRGPITIAISTGGAAPGAGAQAARRDRARAAGRDRPAGALRRDLPRPGAPHARASRARAGCSGTACSTGRVGELALAGDEIAARRELIRLLDSARATPRSRRAWSIWSAPGRAIPTC